MLWNRQRPGSPKVREKVDDRTEKAHGGKAVRFFAGGKGEECCGAALYPVSVFQAGEPLGRENEQDYVLSGGRNGRQDERALRCGPGTGVGDCCCGGGVRAESVDIGGGIGVFGNAVVIPHDGRIHARNIGNAEQVVAGAAVRRMVKAGAECRRTALYHNVVIAGAEIGRCHKARGGTAVKLHFGIKAQFPDFLRLKQAVDSNGGCCGSAENGKVLQNTAAQGMGRVMAPGADTEAAEAAAAGVGVFAFAFGAALRAAAEVATGAAFFNERANMATYRYISPKKSMRGENSVSASDVEINNVTSGA